MYFFSEVLSGSVDCCLTTSMLQSDGVSSEDKVSSRKPDVLCKMLIYKSVTVCNLAGRIACII